LYIRRSSYVFSMEILLDKSFVCTLISIKTDVNTIFLCNIVYALQKLYATMFCCVICNKIRPSASIKLKILFIAQNLGNFTWPVYSLLIQDKFLYQDFCQSQPKHLILHWIFNHSLNKPNSLLISVLIHVSLNLSLTV